MKNALSLTISMLALGATAALPLHASESAETLTSALKGGDATLDLRYRFEYVDSDDGSREAKASTLKTRLTYKSLAYQGVSAVVEMDNNSVVFDDNYNDGSGTDSDPEAVVADATYTEINQAYLNFAAGDNTDIRYGRQRILLDNQRFVGGVGWRQNEQTFDAFSVINRSLPDTTLTLANIYNVNTAKGGNIDGNDHQLYHLLNKSIKDLSISAYYYDLKEMSNTLGLRLNGKLAINDDLALLYVAEYAEQETDNAASNETDYLNVEAGLTFTGITAKLGYELQSSDDGAASFKTPLGTNHAFNGWADQFLVTPNVGLVDQSITLSSARLGPNVQLSYHQFESDYGSTDFGSEVDLSIARKLSENYSVLLKAAHFDADSEGGKKDTSKVWLQLQATF
jgi:hypothetical protein